MAKITSPLIGLHSQGSLGSTLTYREQPRRKEVIATPSHRDARTLPQVYQRWLYYDGCQYWHTLTDEQKAVYRVAGVTHHRTAFQEFMSQYLTLPFDLVLWLRCDQNTTPTTPDSSGHGNTTTRTGAAATAGVIDGGFSFDGTNDYLRTPDSELFLWGTGDFTFTFWFRSPACPDFNKILTKFEDANNRFYIDIQGGKPRVFMLTAGALRFGFVGNANILTNSWLNLAVVVTNGDKCIIYINGVPDSQGAAAAADYSITGDILIAAYDGPSLFFPCKLDDIRHYTRALTPVHINYIYTSERWPTPG